MPARVVDRFPFGPALLSLPACLAVLSLLASASCDRRVDPAEEAGRSADESWARRAPGAWGQWRALDAATPSGAEARRKLEAARAVYEEGVAAFERGDGRASETLRRGASIAPIEPSLYLRLARACRDRGATARAADFYRKYLAETLDVPESTQVERELAALGAELNDPFLPPRERIGALPWLAGSAVLTLLLAAVVVAQRRRRRLGLAALLGRHPERAASFAYLAGTLRHELLKHRIAPLRSADTSALVAPAEPLERAWRRHLDALAAALGLPPPAMRREPLFRAAELAILRLDRQERRADAAPPDREALDTLATLDRALVDWCRLARRTCIDGALMERLVRSLRDEQVGGRLDVEVEVALAGGPLYAGIFHDDLLLVLRNLARNAIEASVDATPKRIRIETAALLDEAGEEWIRIAIHDPSSRRPDRSQRVIDRGLGIVQDTLERYGGALVEVQPAAGYAKAIAASLPRAEGQAQPLASAREAA